MNSAEPLNIYVIAGESSGDVLGSKLMAALKTLSTRPIHFHGVGGELMQKEGLSSQFPMQELSIIGWAELIPHLPNLINRISETAEHIASLKPDILITIDTPGFSFRVVKKLGATAFPKLHFVAPSVWAYKEERAKKVAALYDHLLTLLPFEPPYFEKEGMKATYVGHPVLEETLAGGNGSKFRKKYDIPLDSPCIAVLPGSRRGELTRLLPVYEKAIKRLRSSYPNLAVVVLTLPAFKNDIEMHIRDWCPHRIVLDDRTQRKDALAACDVALTKSGTNTLEIATANLPMVVTYRVNPISAWMLRRVVKVKYVSLVNLVMDAPIIPELLQEDCTPEAIESQLKVLLEDKERREAQIKSQTEALKILGLKQKPTPSENAAKVVLSMVQPEPK